MLRGVVFCTRRWWHRPLPVRFTDDLRTSRRTQIIREPHRQRPVPPSSGTEHHSEQHTSAEVRMRLGFLILMFSAICLAAGPTATLTGRVTDVSGGVIGGGTVEATHVAPNPSLPAH